MEPNENKNDMVDATDCLEAVGTFKSMKNIFFILAIICLLLTQAVFWLNHTGYIDKTSCPCKPKAVSPIPANPAESVLKDEPQVPEISVADEIAVKADTPQEMIDQLAKDAADELSDQTAVTEAVETPDAPAEDTNFFAEIFIPDISQVTVLIRTCNFIVIISACMYCLTLLMTIKISLAGRLGGINHISRAFFRSLLAFVLLMPWQLCTAGVVTGAVYTPKELLCPAGLTAEATLFGNIFYYLRFSGLWAVVIILLIGAQFRSKKWAKATLRRLGIVH